jgi:prepilin-type N-terminal cleavage/methylation domain-containing protein
MPARKRWIGRVHRDERGFTLIELLVTITILGVIAVPLGAALITFFRNTDETTDRFSESHDAQIAAAYFAQDVASLGRRDWTDAPYPLAQSVEVNLPSGAGAFPCGNAGTTLVRLLWDDPTAAKTPTVVRVAYVLQTVDGEQQLHRLRCVGDANPVVDLVLAHNVDSVSPVTCSSSCTSAEVPQTVTLVVHLRAKGTSDPLLDITLTGQRRQT